MAERKASELFVECLEAEGVKHVFGIPGEETLDLNESLDGSSIAFVPVRHEQGGAYMADMYGRLTQRAGVCLGTLGPGRDEPRHRRGRRVPRPRAARRPHRPGRPRAHAQGVAPAHRRRLHAAPRDEVERAAELRPRSSRRWCARRSRSRRAHKPGPTHIELPEDVMAAPSTRRAAAVVRLREPAGAERARAPARRRGHPRRRPARSCSPATASPAAGPRPRCASSPAPRASAWPRRSWARARSTTRTRGRSAPSGCSRATTRSPASRTPTW